MNKDIIIKTGRFALLSTLFSVPLLIWWQHVGDISIYFTDAVPPGQLPYILSKLTGLYALLIMVWQVIISLWERLVRQGILPWCFPWLGLSHRLSGSLIVCFAISHLVLFFMAVTLRQGYPAWPLLVPNFNDYYHIRLTLGLLALICLGLVAVVGFLRHKRKHLSVVAWLHKAYIAAVIFVYWHALAVGSEAQTLIGQGVYWSLGLIMAVLAMLNVWAFLRSRQHNHREALA